MKETVKVRMFKMSFSNQVFNKNQKVWVKKVTGQVAYEVVGKRKGKFNYVSFWIRLEEKELKKHNAEYPKWISIEVPKKFADRLGLDINE